MDAPRNASDSLRAVAAKVLRFRPFLYPSEWMAANCYISGALNGTGHDSLFDPWHFPCNVGIVDALCEGRRGILVQKSVQMGVSQYMQNLVLYFMARMGGPAGYSMAKDETVREHVLDRLEPSLEHSAELKGIYLPGRDNHETIRSKRFMTGTLKFFGAGTPNNFKSNPYVLAVADEFELMKVFPDGSDAVALLKGRQAAFSFPIFIGFSTPLEADSPRGIEAAVLRDSDCRLFYWRCPHCREPINVNFMDNVKFDREPVGNRIVRGTARLLCPKCGHAITDAERAAALVRAARAAAPWYAAEPYDAEVGWHSTLTSEEAAGRRYAGFMGLEALHNPRTKLADLADEYCSITSEPERKTFCNDRLARGYTIRARQLARGDIEGCIAEASRSTVPAETLFITLGSDVQGGGPDTRRSVFYYDISAWVKTTESTIRKVTLFVDRVTSTDEDGHATIKNLLRTWTTTDTRGNVRRIDMACFDSTFRTKTVNAICNTLSAGGVQWCIPVIYGSRKQGDADYEPLPQTEEQGDPRRCFYITSRNYLVGRYVDLVTDERQLLELPEDTTEEVIAHYLANEMVRRPDHNGVLRDMWVKKTEAGKRLRDDDWFAAGCYSFLAALILGLDKMQSAEITEAAAEADRLAVARIQQRASRSGSEAARRARMHQRLARHYRGG